ncbi:relaxase/mobilization nuclease domain-containing protein [Aliarcobacter cryaerophilus]|uniref:hypothetical protein n=1 Tax=Aliarcobacter cryaerophilus TaxID=28198 RepID=UPI003DA59BC8
MVVKFFKPPTHGGSAGAIQYLLNNKRVKNGTARVLQGDVDITRKLIETNPHKQKVDVGCLSFEEANIDERIKFKLMQGFEEMLLPQMQGKYNILWVEHTDKGRLELNFCIPKIELEKNRALTPYLHKADLPRVETWQSLQNLIYNFSDPKDPAKARTVELNSKVKNLNLDYDNLDKILHKKVNDGEIESREQIIQLLRDSNITVTRTGKDYLAIKLPNSKKARRYKGAIYHEQFTSLSYITEELRNQQAKINQYSNRDTRAEIKRLETKLSEHIERKRAELQKRYKYAEPKNEENEDVSLLVINRHRNKLSKLFNPYKPDTENESPRRAEQNDILHRDKKEIRTVDYAFILHRKIRVVSIPYADYREKIKLIIGDRYKIEKRNNGHISFRDTGNKFKIITDKGNKISCNNTPNQEDIRLMINIGLCKGWKLEDLRLNTNIPEAKKMFDKEIQKIKVDRANMMAIKKEDTNIQKDIPVPVEKEEDKKVENNYNYYTRGI